MATSAIVVRGADGTPAPAPPVNGNDALPLADGGRGTSGKTAWWGLECTLSATPGAQGNPASGAPPASNGGTGRAAPSLSLTIAKISTSGPLAITVSGGTGARGGNGGIGGTGGQGGQAGTQPTACTTKYGPVKGGPGGPPGHGGDAGTGGAGGDGALASVIYDERLTKLDVSLNCIGGSGGDPGDPGKPGTPGKGGLGSDGTPARDGTTASPGGVGGQSSGGSSGSGSVTPVSTLAVELKLVVARL